ncbi:MAG: ABC transporter ATP-binding protein [Pseudomonadota bacterium]
MLLDIKETHTYYGKSHILHGVSMEVEKGEIVTLLGRNGVGKSTILKSIMGLVTPRNGSIQFKGQDIVGMKPHKICHLGVGYVPEDRRIFPKLTVRQNLHVGLKPKQKVENPWTIDRVYEFFPQLGERDNQKGGNLSGGEQQMLTIGRTLMGNPEILLVDEPTEGLAPLLVDMVVENLQSAREAGISILLVEHAMDVALGLADRTYVMSKGEIVFHGTGEELRENKEVRKKYLEI